jgi:uncharacterized surface protein with fasciclin (FAS1) repeats
MDKNNKTGVIVGVVALLAIVGGIVWYTSSQNEDTNMNNASESSQQTETTQTESTQDIVALASGNQDLSTLVTAVKAADLVSTLQGEGPYTVFAPTNAAFAALPAGTLDTLLEPANKSQLSGILTYHVVAGDITSDQLKDGQVVKTVNGQDLTVNVRDGKVTITDAKGGTATVVTADVDASNGVVHVIDAVLLPQ